MIGYYTLVKGMSNPFELRIEMVTVARQVGISETARQFKTTRKTVRKWLRRFETECCTGLQNRSRRPKRSPNKLRAKQEQRIIELRQKHPSWGPDRLILHYALPWAVSTISRVIKAAGLTRHRKKKKRYKDYAELHRQKQHIKPFELIQIDTKTLMDIPPHARQRRQGIPLPRYQVTARDVRTGGLWFGYAEENTSTNAALFALYLAEHLKHYGIDLKRSSFQSDNGSEFVGSTKKKKRLSAFEQVLADYGIHHSRIPPHSPTYNSEVEASHRLIEDEFYECEQYRDSTQFYAKAYAYQLFFNYERINMWRNSKPSDILNTEAGKSISPEVFNLPPPLLDSAVHLFKGGYHVSKEVNVSTLLC